MANLPILLQLQTIDSRLQALNRTRDEARHHQNLIALELLEGELMAQGAAQTAELAETRASQRRLELDLKTSQERLRSEEQKLYGGSISSSRELEKLQQKIAELRRTKEDLEERVLHLMETDERLTGQLESVQKRQEAAKTEADAIRKDIELRLAEIAIETEGLTQEREVLLGQIPPEWLERYHKIAKAHHGLAIAKMKKSQCGACHIEVSESLLQKAKRGDDTLVFCENCGRILYY